MGDEMKYEDIKVIADKYKNILQPYCKRIEVAGSIRRKKYNPRDIELVLIRDPEKALTLAGKLAPTDKIKGSIYGRYTQRMTPEGIKLDIFIAVDDGTNWGNIFLIRTGNWKFSRFMMGIRAPQVGLKHREGYLWRDNVRIDCYEETDVFRELEMKYIEPEGREWD